MSKDNVKKPRSREERKKAMVRLLALIMVILMVGGSVVSALIYAVGASDVESASVQTLDTSSLKNSGDVLISVGLNYGSNLTKSFGVWSDEGYIVGSQLLIGDKDFTELWDIGTSYIACTVDDNLTDSSGSFVLAKKAKNADIGGWHIEISDDFDRDDLEDLIEDTENDLDDLGLYAIPSYIDQEYVLRVGSFTSEEDAENALDDVEDLYRKMDVEIVSPSTTAVSVIDPDRHTILFEFDCRAELELGLAAHEDSSGNTYMSTPAGNIYDGVFCFKRYDNGDVEGVQLANILPLESYLAGVLPYETSNTWPLETLKAFAITVRSYTLSHLGKHVDRYGFDLCNTVDCQVYRGMGSVNKRIVDAVLGTAGKILIYGDEIVNAYYSSSMGGVTVSAEDAWGGQDKLPYLKAVETPWERYMIHNNGFWMYEISPKALCDHLNQKGYTTLEDEIEDVEILELAENSTYVKTLRVTDIHGESVTITTTDKVRISLTPYVKSANFVVGRGQVEYTENVVIDENYTTETPEVPEENEYVGGNTISGKDSGYADVDGTYVITADEIDRHYTSIWTSIATGEETVLYDKIDFFVMTSGNAHAFLGEEYEKYAEAEEEEPEPDYNTEVVADKSDSETVYKVAYARDEDNFIFVGKGWGHGVGMSQYGARDLADMGYGYEDILNSYFTDVEIIDWEDFQ
ncbi:MAG: SpoIID/LytB domain-containing protein [Clostridia bacterium]|nr:SpoIID/LytB domain-containing protein [Clostridia bacterium]